MKKLISILLAVSVLAASTCASAVSLKAGGQRNPGTGGTADNNSNFLRDYSDAPGQLAVYRPGDTLTFSEESSAQISKGDVITFISSKLEATDAELNSATVMFIDQIVADSDNPLCSYKIRDGLAEGIYKIDIKIGATEVDTFYYSIADPKIEIAYVDEEETIQAYYDEKDGKTYYFAAATLGTDKVTYNQIGVDSFGFQFDEKNTFTVSAATFDAAIAEQELEGTINWFFSIGILNDIDGEIPNPVTVLINE